MIRIMVLHIVALLCCRPAINARMQGDHLMPNAVGWSLLRGGLDRDTAHACAPGIIRQLNEVHPA